MRKAGRREVEIQITDEGNGTVIRPRWIQPQALGLLQALQLWTQAKPRPPVAPLPAKSGDARRSPRACGVVFSTPASSCPFVFLAFLHGHFHGRVWVSKITNKTLAMSKKMRAVF
jgi:hypothetical protein